MPTDKYVAAYCLVLFALSFRSTTLTDSFRTLFNLLVDVALPYLAVTRCVMSREGFARVLAAIVASGAAMALVGIFEAVKKWLLYSMIGGVRQYDLRAGFQRASVSFPSPIIYGFHQMICLGSLLGLTSAAKVDRRHLVLAGLFSLAMLMSFSRGPWVAAVGLALIYAYFSRNSVRALAPLIVGAAVVLGVLSMTSVGQQILNFLPFIGSARDDTIVYRQQLLANGIEVFWRSPFFGSSAYMQTNELEALRQGQGIIDIVNTYLGVGLAYGLAGLIPFVGLQASALWQLWKTIRHSKKHDLAWYQIHRALFATIIGVMILLATASSIDRTLQYYWCLAGLASASCYAFRREKAVAKAEKDTFGQLMPKGA